MFIYYFSKINQFKMVPRWSWCSQTPSVTSTSSTLASTARSSFVHQKLKWHMLIYNFSMTIRFKRSQGDQDALGHPQRPRQGQPWGVQQVPVMYIKNWHDTCLYAIFQRQIYLQESQRDTVWSRCSRIPSATSTSSTMGSSASPSYEHQNLTWHMFIYYFSKTNLFQTSWRNTGWSRCS